MCDGWKVYTFVRAAAYALVTSVTSQQQNCAAYVSCRVVSRLPERDARQAKLKMRRDFFVLYLYRSLAVESSGVPTLFDIWIHCLLLYKVKIHCCNSER